MAGMKVEISEKTLELVKRFSSAIEAVDALEPGCDDWEKAYDEYKDAKNACAIRLVSIVEFGVDCAGS